MRSTAFFVFTGAILFIGGAFALCRLKALNTCVKGVQANSPRPWTSAWKARLEDPHLTAAEFTQLCAAAALTRLRRASLSVPEPLTVKIRLADGTEGAMSLDNAWLNCRDDPSARIEMCERWVGMAAELESKPAAGAQNIVPLIRDRQFLDQVPQKAGLKAEHLVADLWIVYAEDLPNSIYYLTGGAPTIDLELRQRAIRHLRSVLPNVEKHGDGPCYMLTAGGNFEASLLLLNEIWDRQAKEVDGELVAAVPSRDVVLFTGSHSQAGLAELRSAVHRIHSSGSYPVSETLLVWRHGVWQEYAPSGA